jgi:hypothetical protein
MKSHQSWDLAELEDSDGAESMSTSDDFDFSSDESDNESVAFNNSLVKPFDMKLLQQSIESGSKVFDDIDEKKMLF